MIESNHLPSGLPYLTTGSRTRETFIAVSKSQGKNDSLQFQNANASTGQVWISYIGEITLNIIINMLCICRIEMVSTPQRA
jgi:hypothetical protein